MSRTGIQLCDDILNSAASIQQHLNGVSSLPQFSANPMLRDAVSYRVALIGETAGKLRQSHGAKVALVCAPSYDLATKLKLFYGIRNKLIHAHWGKSSSLMVNMMKKDLAPLVTAIQHLRTII